MNYINSKVVKASLNHYNRLSNTSDEATLVNLSCARISSLALYVPRNIDIDKMLEEYPPSFNYHRDHFIYILHLISSIPSKKKDVLENYDGYTPLYSKLLQKRNKNYKKYLNYLRERGVIRRSSHYIPGEKSYGYKFTESFNSPVTPVVIRKYTLIKSITKNNEQHNSKKTEELFFLRQWFNPKLQVNISKGRRYLKREYKKDLRNHIENPIQRYNSRLLPLLKLHGNNYDFHADNKGFRLHTILTQLKSELRKHVKYDSKNLCAVDIKNSQPFLSITLLSKDKFILNKMNLKIQNPNISNESILNLIEDIENKADVIEFKKLVSSGQFYEEFGKLLIEQGIIENEDQSSMRKKAKEITFSTLFSPNTSISYNKAIKVFKSNFPNVYKVFKLIKKGRKRHNTLAIALQRLEAELVLEKTCKIINVLYPNIPLFTLHDSIITIEEHVGKVELIMRSVLSKQIGITPNLKLEPWT